LVQVETERFFCDGTARLYFGLVGIDVNPAILFSEVKRSREKRRDVRDKLRELRKM
jgi:hypothetical protein